MIRVSTKFHHRKGDFMKTKRIMALLMAASMAVLGGCNSSGANESQGNASEGNNTQEERRQYLHLLTSSRRQMTHWKHGLMKKKLLKNLKPNIRDVRLSCHLFHLQRVIMRHCWHYSSHQKAQRRIFLWRILT